MPGFLDEFMPQSNEASNLAGSAFLDEVPSHLTSLRTPLRTGRAATRIGDDDIRLLGTVQSRRQTSGIWDVDWNLGVVAWVRIRDDGDYVYDDELTQAVPTRSPN